LKIAAHELNSRTTIDIERILAAFARIFCVFLPKSADILFLVFAFFFPQFTC